MKTYPEPLVARVLGPKKSILVEVRRTMLKKGEHWTTVGNVVQYTEPGLAALCRAMDLDHQPVLDEVAKNSAADAPPSATGPAAPAPPATAPQPEASSSPVTIGETEKQSPQAPPAEPTVTLAAQVQRAVVAPLREAVDIVVMGRSPNPLIVFGVLDGQPVKVRVRNNATFMRGLVLRAKPSSDGPYLMVGHPPRWLGDKIGFTRPAVFPLQSNQHENQ